MTSLLSKTSQDGKREIKLCILGEANVGKTSLSFSLKNGRCTTTTCSTVGAAYLKVTSDEKYNINIWDTAGSERFHALMPMYIRGAEVCIGVFDITKKDTFLNLTKMKHKFDKEIEGCEDAIWIFVGTMWDMNEISQINEFNIQTLKQETETTNIHHFFVSNVSGDGVALFKQNLYDQIREKFDDEEQTDRAPTFEKKKQDVVILTNTDERKINIPCCNTK